MKGVNVRLSVMMFLQFFIWGAWYTTIAVYMTNQGMASFRQKPERAGGVGWEEQRSCQLFLFEGMGFMRLFSAVLAVGLCAILSAGIWAEEGKEAGKAARILPQPTGD